MRKLVCRLAVAAVLLVGAGAQAENAPGGKLQYPTGAISGDAFGDFYYDVVGNPNHEYNSSGADSLPPYIVGTYPTTTPDVIGKDLNGFAFRRIDFQLDNLLSTRVATRFRLEVDGKSLTSNGKITVAVKNAYIRVANLTPGGNFYFGMVPTPTWERRDEFWRYRSVEKTIADFHGLGNGSDLGVALKGSVGGKGEIGYSAMIGNGNGEAPANNRYKKFYLSLPLNLTAHWNLEPYVDYTAGPNGTSVTNYEIGGGLQGPYLTWGFQVVDNVAKFPGAPTQEPFGYSIFALGPANTTITGYARFDHWEPDTRAANRVDQNLYLVGGDWRVTHGFHVLPNVEWTQYHGRGTAAAPPYHDLQGRLTLFYLWSKP